MKKAIVLIGFVEIVVSFLPGFTGPIAAQPDSHRDTQQDSHRTKDSATPQDSGSQLYKPAPSFSPDLLAQLKTADSASCSSLIEQIKSTVVTASDIKAIAKEFLQAFGNYRSRLVILINRLVQGDIPSYLINRLGDPSVGNILQKPEQIISAHEEYVQDWERFAQTTPSEKHARLEFLILLKQAKEMLSACDCDYIDRQIEELKLDDGTVSYIRGNAWLMLGFNYNYFYALSCRDKILNCLKKAIAIEKKLALDSVFLEVAHKNLAFEDAEFCTLFKQCGGRFSSEQTGNFKSVPATSTP